MHHAILMKMLSLTHWNVSDTVNKFQLCTSNLKVPTHESNYVYRYEGFGNIFKDRAIGKSRFWARMHHSISMKILSLTHWNVSDTVNKFQLCTSNLKVPTHESKNVHCNVRYANSFKGKAILTLGNQDFEQGCIIQYRWIFCP